jgi:DNA-binding MarR family transcriptional regulator
LALGYVNKVQDEKDRRAFRVSLMVSGREIAERVNETLRRWVEIITVDVPLEDIVTVNRVFEQFYQNALKGMG